MRFLRDRGSRLAGLKWLVVAAMLAAGARVWATPPLGFVVNQILATGTAAGGIGQHMQVFKNPDGSFSPWLLNLQVLGDTDYYSQHLVLSAGGYSGWHSHPGLLVGAVTAGQIDFYDAHCQKRTIGAGQVFTENDDVHAIINVGTVDADLNISYLVKHGSPRRRDETAPACAPETGIP